MRLLCETRQYQTSADTHYHHYGQLILPLKGSLSIQTEHFNVDLDQHHLFFLPPECSHTFYAKNKNQFLVIDIPNELSHVLIGDIIRDEQYRILDERWKAIKYLITEESKRQNIRALEDLLTYAFGYLREDVVPKSIQYIHKHYDQPITCEELAYIENYNVSHYIEWFKKKTGLTPNTYIQKIRLEHAKRYIEQTNYSLLMISNLVGYEHQSSLTRLFKSFGYLSPSQYRKDTRDMDKKEIVMVK